MTNVEKAVAQFGTKSACSQSVASAFAEEVGLDFSLIHKLTTGFGGGIGGKQDICGAITGGVLILNAKYGSAGPEEADAKAKTKEKVASFMDAVEARLGVLNCRDILGTDLEDAKEKDWFATVCTDVVRVCAEEVEKLL